MKQSWKQPKTRILELETAPALVYSAFAQDHNLLPAPQRIHDNGPFFESRPHGQKLRFGATFGNRAAVIPVRGTILLQLQSQQAIASVARI